MIRDALSAIKKKCRLFSFRAKWRKKNPHNFSYPNTVFPIDKVTVGNNTYADLNVYSYRNAEEKLRIGNYCSIASDVLFILSGEHSYHCVSTYPFVEKVFNESIAAGSKGPIVVQDDVWIGVRTTVLSGVTIGQGAVIGANSIVYKDVPPYAIYAGNKIIGMRFSDEIVSKLLTIDFAAFSEEVIQCFHKIYNTNVTNENVDELIKCLPKKTKEKING